MHLVSRMFYTVFILKIVLGSSHTNETYSFILINFVKKIVPKYILLTHC